MTGSILSDREDGCGYYYGTIPDDGRQMNVRLEEEGLVWRTYIGSTVAIAAGYTKHQAEELGRQWAKDNPE